MHAGYNASVNGVGVHAWSMSSPVVRRVLLFWLALSGFAVSALAGTYPLPANASETAAWVLTDLDGDRAVDLASSDTGRRDGRGYVHNVNIYLTGFEATSFVVRGPSASIRLSFRDVDGDKDRDLIVLEPWSSRPVGLWLNDGDGHFQEADVTAFASKIGKPPSRSFDSRRASNETSANIHDQRSSSEYFPRFVAVLAHFRCNTALNSFRFIPAISPDGFGPRGPPRTL
jgi:FG-GAP-like repeat